MAFFGCAGLSSVVIPDSVTSIGDEAFVLCDNLTRFMVTEGSYAEQYAEENGIPYVYTTE